MDGHGPCVAAEPGRDPVSGNVFMCYVLGSWDSVQTLSHRSHCPGGRNRHKIPYACKTTAAGLKFCSLEKQYQPH